MFIHGYISDFLRSGWASLWQAFHKWPGKPVCAVRARSERRQAASWHTRQEALSRVVDWAGKRDQSSRLAWEEDQRSTWRGWGANLWHALQKGRPPLPYLLSFSMIEEILHLKMFWLACRIGDALRISIFIPKAVRDCEIIDAPETACH